MLELIIIAGLLNTTLLICFKKWKWLQWYAIHKQPWMPAADCYLCLGFWMAAFEIVGVIYLFGWMYIIVPFCSAALTNYFTNIGIINDYNQGRN